MNSKRKKTGRKNKKKNIERKKGRKKRRRTRWLDRFGRESHIHSVLIVGKECTILNDK